MFIEYVQLKSHPYSLRVGAFVTLGEITVEITDIGEFQYSEHMSPTLLIDCETLDGIKCQVEVPPDQVVYVLKAERSLYEDTKED